MPEEKNITPNALVFDPIFKDHHASFEHPERPERLDAVYEGLAASGFLSTATRVSTRKATTTELNRVHNPVYVKKVIERLGTGSGYLDPDTFYSEGTLNAALCAAGSGVDLAMGVHTRNYNWGFAAVRPPGHHATISRACGFCIFNNIAVAAAAIQRRYPGARIAIIDFDVHHGNGTQDQFYDNGDVLYISMHQWPHFPGSGLANETGRGKGEGTTINLPFSPGTNDAAYLSGMRDVVEPAVTAFKPDHLLVSAGFDLHVDDPMANMNVTQSGIEQIGSAIAYLATTLCQGRLTVFLEGGYNLDVVKYGISGFIRAIDAPCPINISSKARENRVESTQ